MKHSTITIILLLLSAASSTLSLNAEEIVLEATPHANQNWDENEINKPTLEELEKCAYSLGVFRIFVEMTDSRGPSEAHVFEATYALTKEYVNLQNSAWAQALELAYRRGNNLLLDLVEEYQEKMPGAFVLDPILIAKDKRIRKVLATIEKAYSVKFMDKYLGHMTHTIGKDYALYVQEWMQHRAAAQTDAPETQEMNVFLI